MRLSRRFLAIVGAADPPPHGFPSRCPCRLWHMTDKGRIVIDDDEAIELPFHMIRADAFAPDKKQTNDWNN